MQAKAPDFTTATAWRSAVTGVGATAGGRPCVQGPDGRLNAEAHKGQHEHRQQQLPVTGVARQMAPSVKSCAPLTMRNTRPMKASAAPLME